jgi:hypothetical protein
MAEAVQATVVAARTVADAHTKATEVHHRSSSRSILGAGFLSTQTAVTTLVPLKVFYIKETGSVIGREFPDWTSGESLILPNTSNGPYFYHSVFGPKLSVRKRDGTFRHAVTGSGENPI